MAGAPVREDIKEGLFSTASKLNLHLSICTQVGELGVGGGGGC